VKYAFWLLMMSSLAHAACPSDQAKDGTALVQTEQSWARALDANDVPTLACILAPDFEEADATGNLWDRSHMLERAAKPDNAHYELSELHPHVYGDFGYIRGLGVAVKDEGRVTVKTRFTDIFVYRDGRWQCVAGQESAMPPAAH
jgi:ketosteroid isomerase-like protein